MVGVYIAGPGGEREKRAGGNRSFIFIFSFIYFWLCRVLVACGIFVAMCGLFIVARGLSH